MGHPPLKDPLQPKKDLRVGMLVIRESALNTGVAVMET